MPYIVVNPLTAAAAPATTAGAPKMSVGATLASLRADLLGELANRSDATPTKLNSWINKAYEYMCSILDLDDLKADAAFNLVADQPLYNLPEAAASVQGVRVIDTANYPIDGGINLTGMDFDLYSKLPNDTVGLPRAYFVKSRVLGIYATPRVTTSAVLSFKVRPDPLVADTDSPILPPEFHETLLLRAKHTAMRALKDYTGAGLARNDFVADIRAINDNDAATKAEVPHSVRPIFKASDLNRLR